MKLISLQLFCQFSPDELADKANELALATIEFRDLEEEKADSAKEFSERIKDIRGRMAGLARAYKNRGEQRMVECVVKLDDPSSLQKTTIRTDTNEVVRIEMMTPEERQQVLFEQTHEANEVVDRILAEPDARNQV